MRLLERERTRLQSDLSASVALLFLSFVLQELEHVRADNGKVSVILLELEWQRCATSHGTKPRWGSP